MLIHRHSNHPGNLDEQRGYRGFAYTCFRDTNASTPRACVTAKAIKLTPLTDLIVGDLMIVTTNIGRLILASAHFTGNWGFLGVTFEIC